MSRGLNLEGQKFSRLTVISKAKKRGERNFWLCKCDCGKLTEVSTANLRSGAVKSCGCLNIDAIKCKNTKHGQRGTRLYKIWVDLRRRCNNPKYKSYNNYGGRGISVCKEWDDNFLAFYEWAHNNGYSDNLSIDRIDNNKGYFPENCRWATILEQNRNKRNCHYVTICGVTKTIMEWCEYYGVNEGMVRGRLQRGWNEIKALITPKNNKRYL